MAKKKPVDEVSIVSKSDLKKSAENMNPLRAMKPSLDADIGKALTPKKEEKNLDQAEKDFAEHLKFAKFKK